MTSTTLITGYLGEGTAASRPVTPALPTGGIGFYYATDTLQLSMWDVAGAAWVPILTERQSTLAVSTATATLTPTFGTGSAVITVSHNTTLTIANGVYPGQRIRLELLQDATGSRTIAFDSSVEFGTSTGFTSFTASTAANKRDLVTLIWNSTASKWMFVDQKLGFA